MGEVRDIVGALTYSTRVAMSRRHGAALAAHALAAAVSLDAGVAASLGLSPRPPQCIT